MMFGWFKKRRRAEMVIVAEDHGDYSRMREIQKALGFPGGGGSDDWLRLHEILKDHEDRLAKLDSH